MKLICSSMLIAALAGMVICDLQAKDYKTAAIGVLFAAANVLIFIVK